MEPERTTGFRSWSVSRAKPRTYIGQLLRAMLLRQDEERRRLSGMVNGGRDGWNDDEPAVVEAVFEQAMRSFFGTEYSIGDISAFVEDTREAAASEVAVDQLAAEALIRYALDETDITVIDITRGQRYVLRGVFTAAAVGRLGIDEAAVNQLITEGERLAFERGWRPPLIKGTHTAG